MAEQREFVILIPPTGGFPISIQYDR